MRTFTAICNKIEQLKDNLAKKEVYEDFGQKEIHELNDFIGDFWSYDNLERLAIMTVQTNFSNWCGTYNGSK